MITGVRFSFTSFTEADSRGQGGRVMRHDWGGGG